MNLDALTLVVIAANVLGAAMAIPQAGKLLRSRRGAGVSLTWAAVSIVVNAWWVVYGLGVGDLGIVPVSALAVACYLLITVCLVRYRQGPVARLIGRTVAVAAAVAAVPAFVLWAEGWAAAGIALGALYGIQLSPAVVAVYRATDVGGVSLATWLIAFAEAALWGVYGFARSDLGLLALAATGTMMSSLVLARLFLRRPRRTSVVVFGGPAYATA